MDTILSISFSCLLSITWISAIRYSTRYGDSFSKGDDALRPTNASRHHSISDGIAVVIAGAGIAIPEPPELSLILALTAAGWGIVVAIRTDFACREIPLSAQLSLALGGLAFGYSHDGSFLPACLRMLAGGGVGVILWLVMRGEAQDGRDDGFGLGDAMLLMSLGSLLISMEAAALAFTCLGLWSGIMKLRHQLDMAGAPPLIVSTLVGLAGHWIF